MRHKNTNKLIEDFIDAAEKHREATTTNSQRANKQAKRIHKIFLEIIDSGTSAREALLQLTNHDNLAVASMAAVYSLKYNPEKSLAVLKQIAQTPGVIGFEARHAIQRWEEGVWELE